MVTWGQEEEAARDPLTCQGGSNLKKEQETMVVADQGFAQKEAATAQAPTHPKIDEGVEPFLQACMKFLCNPQTVENLQDSMNSFVAWPNPSPRTKDVHKLYMYKKCTGREMWLTAQIGHYEMDKVVLDLGLDANVLPKKTWKRMGESKLE